MSSGRARNRLPTYRLLFRSESCLQREIREIQARTKTENTDSWMGTGATFQLTQHLRTGRRSCLCAGYEGGRWWVQVSCISQKTWLMQTRTHTFHLVNMLRSRCVCVKELFSHHFISNPMHVVGPGRSVWLCVHLCVQITLEIKIHDTSGRQRVTTLLDAISSTYTISKEGTKARPNLPDYILSIHTETHKSLASLWSLSGRQQC